MRAIQLFGTLLLLIIVRSVSAQENPNRDDRFDTRFVYESRVTIDMNRATVGPSKYGERGIIWITGGDVKGPKINAEVLSGGGDWQLGRPDGSQELKARYAIKTTDGHVILVHNSAIIAPRPTPDNPKNEYARSVLNFEAPLGSPYEWMNNAIFLGTVEPAPNFEDDPAVIIRVWELL
ncbi:DUF3237 domain-containing protein [Alteromonas gilva]|uniref:DUF3237 domain-containing protein n=1 Tax=Alteromonas gilva TaxID=2987522 RepID=A0ABT5L045_9ALTE|nr:DUF3237 domain-containing protein [Alteromonas gilva]MDC8830248.1 DUF3237 domain-containing protein [Alteromonas gilva]